MDKDVINILIQHFFFVDIYFHVSRKGRYMFNFVRNCQTFFQVVEPFYTLTSSMQNFICSTFLLTLV